MSRENRDTTALATLGGGCFWCVEAVFQRLKGVRQVVSGYAGGRSPNPTYPEVCGGASGHAEVCQIGFDPAQVGFTELLEVFFQIHDPTTLNRQGNDTGTQYRSVIFYHDQEQRKEAESCLKRLQEARVFRNPIVTEVAPLEVFYPAEEYHQNYFSRNPAQGYCAAVVAPKVAKFQKAFPDRLR